MGTKMTVGEVELLALVDLTPPPFPPERFFPDLALSAWEPHRQYLDASGNIPIQMGCFVLRTPSGVVLVDTGLGPGPHQPMGGAQGQLLNGLHSEGIGLEEVSFVLITHLHGDHIGWNLRQEGDVPKPTFPRARYLLPRGDWDHFTAPEVLARNAAVQANAVPLQALGVLELVEGGHVVTPEVSTLATPGHTPGHLCVLVSSRGQSALIVGDLFHSPAQVSEADWSPGADWDKEASRRSRHATLDRAEREGFVLAAGHLLLGQNLGRVLRSEGRRYWQAL